MTLYNTQYSKTLKIKILRIKCAMQYNKATNKKVKNHKSNARLGK